VGDSIQGKVYMIFDDRGIVGFDVSFYQSYYNRERDTWTYIDWELMKQSGISFVICKAGQNDYYDPTFSYNWFEARKVGIPRASYWFLDYRSSPKLQAQKYWELMEPDPGEGPLIVDFEKGSSGFWDDVYAFITELQRLSGYPDHKIWIYTGYYYWIDAFKFGEEANQLWFGKYPLWLAWYCADEDEVIIPPPWKKCVLWQQGTPPIGKSVGAQSKEIDYNVFNGDDLSLAYYFDGVDPHIIEEQMYFKALTTLNIRSSAAALTTNDLGDFNLLAGDIVEVADSPTLNGGVTWRKIVKIWRNSQPLTFPTSPTGEYWAAEKGSAVWMTVTTFTPPTPANHVVEVFIDGNCVFRQELS
jgi:GH25 family lysozyme M1 (1,4-beta-N-acetylmuramidase)